MKEKKYLFGAIILAIIILLIIWYRNSQKSNSANAAKAKLIAGNNTVSTVDKSEIGKTGYVNGEAVFYNANDFSVAYTKNTNGEWAGIITAVQTDDGITSFYKLTNSNGDSVYALKGNITVK